MAIDHDTVNKVANAALAWLAFQEMDDAKKTVSELTELERDLHDAVEDLKT